MTAQQIEAAEPVVARPERTPAALRIALAQVAPHRLPEMEQQKDEAIALAARTRSLGPINQFLESWAVAIEIARTPALAARLRAAVYTARSVHRDDPAWREAMDEIHALQIWARDSIAPI
ncbi:hypothetical protein AB0C59_19410 [Streptomyces sp. NPDC048664]|uniref:hypothetical protein n=1 Tax=Streptomyces sp. NPDC048664 TaxID=3154505 RepID=UPI00341FAB79